MASPTAIGLVSTAAIAVLQANAAVIALVPAERIADEIPARMVFPYVLVESSGERPFNTLGAYGSVAGLRVRVLSQYRGDAEVASIVGAIKGALDDQPLVVTGYPTVHVLFQSVTPMRDFGAVVTREWVADFDVRVHQT
jgi:hypothetical protein